MNFFVAVGRNLPNGSTLLCVRHHKESGVWVVLADTGETPMRWATWKSNAKGHTVYGNYHSSIAVAAKDFEDR